MFRIYILIAVVGLVGGVVYGGYYFYKDTQDRIRILTENNAKLEVAKKMQDDTIQTLVEDADKYRKLNNELNNKIQKAEEYSNGLIAKLRKHDLTRLSQQKPGLVEKKINDGTRKLFESLERLTAIPSVK